MLFFPFKVDISLSRTPYLTILIAIACLVIYWQQENISRDIVAYADTFCAAQKGQRHKTVMKKLYEKSEADENSICISAITSIHFSDDPNKTISKLVSQTTRFSTKSLERTHTYINDHLHKKYDEFKKDAPEDLTRNLWYSPDSFNIVKMISSTFSHSSWSHVIGNLFFFFAFAASIEIILGSVIFFIVIAGLAVGTNASYALAVYSAPEVIPTLGLSGVVMGMIGMFIYFIPKERILCFFWFIIIIKKFSIPAWILAIWYFGWDVYGLYSTGTSSSVNLIAHVSGFILGYIIGMTFFKWRKQELIEEIKQMQYSKDMAAVMNKP